MSDTPTQRLPEAGGTATPDGEGKKTRTLLIALIAIAALLLAGVVVLIVVLLVNPGGAATPAETPTETATPSESPTPTETATGLPASPTPSATPSATAAPPPPDNSPAFTSLNHTQAVMCNTSFPPGYTPPTVTFSYTTKNAAAVWFMFGEGDASQAAAFPMPLSGSQNDVYGGSPLEFPCPQASAKYTLTIIGTNGQKVHRTFTVVNNGDKS